MTCALLLPKVLAGREEGAIKLTLTGGLGFVEKLAQVSGKPIVYNAMQSRDTVPDSFRKILGWMHRTRNRGNASIRGMAIFNGSEEYFSFDEYNLLEGSRAWREVTLGTVKERIEAMQNEANREHPRGQFDTGRIPSVTGPVQDFKVDRTFRPENKKYEGKRERIGSASVVARLARNKISSCHARQSRGSRIRVRLNRVNESISVSDGRPGGGAPGMALGKFVDYAGRNFSPEHSLNKMS